MSSSLKVLSSSLESLKGVRSSESTASLSRPAFEFLIDHISDIKSAICEQFGYPNQYSLSSAASEVSFRAVEPTPHVFHLELEVDFLLLGQTSMDMANRLLNHYDTTHRQIKMALFYLLNQSPLFEEFSSIKSFHAAVKTKKISLHLRFINFFQSPQLPAACNSDLFSSFFGIVKKIEHEEQVVFDDPCFGSIQASVQCLEVAPIPFNGYSLSVISPMRRLQVVLSGRLVNTFLPGDLVRGMGVISPSSPACEVAVKGPSMFSASGNRSVGSFWVKANNMWKTSFESVHFPQKRRSASMTASPQSLLPNPNQDELAWREFEEARFADWALTEAMVGTFASSVSPGYLKIKLLLVCSLLAGFLVSKDNSDILDDDLSVSSTGGSEGPLVDTVHLLIFSDVPLVRRLVRYAASFSPNAFLSHALTNHTKTDRRGLHVIFNNRAAKLSDIRAHLGLLAPSSEQPSTRTVWTIFVKSDSTQIGQHELAHGITFSTPESNLISVFDAVVCVGESAEEDAIIVDFLLNDDRFAQDMASTQEVLNHFSDENKAFAFFQAIAYMEIV